MAEIDKNDDFENWYPTYGVMTAERILGRYNIKLDYKALIAAVKNSESIYYQLLKVPLKNVYSGILMDHASEYQSYVQKLFVDYLVSGQADAPEGSPGETTREAIEELRQELKRFNEHFEQEQAQRRELIASSQALLMNHGREINNLIREIAKLVNSNVDTTESITDITHMVHEAITESKALNQDGFKADSAFWSKLSELLGAKPSEGLIEQSQQYFNQLEEISSKIDQESEPLMGDADGIIEMMKHEKSSIYQLILKVKEQLSFLPEYRDGEERAQENLSSITFDPKFGIEQSEG